MACNSLAVTKTLISDQHILDLLDQNKEELVMSLKQTKELTVQQTAYGVDVYAWGEYYQIVKGKVSYRGMGQPDYMNDIEEAVSLTATALLANELEGLLEEAITSRSEERVTNDGKEMLAVVFGIDFNNVVGRVFVLPDHQVQILIDEGEWTDAVVTSGAIVEALKGTDAEVTQIGVTESHQESVSHVHQMNRHVHEH